MNKDLIGFFLAEELLVIYLGFSREVFYWFLVLLFLWNNETKLLSLILFSSASYLVWLTFSFACKINYFWNFLLGLFVWKIAFWLTAVVSYSYALPSIISFCTLANKRGLIISYSLLLLWCFSLSFKLIGKYPWLYVRHLLFLFRISFLKLSFLDNYSVFVVVLCYVIDLLVKLALDDSFVGLWKIEIEGELLS